MVDRGGSGLVKISNEAIAAIAQRAALEVDGVSGVWSDLLEDLKNLFRKGEGRKGVRVNIRNDTVRVELTILVRYGINIADIAHNVQENVRGAIEKMTGLAPVEVDVRVQGIGK
jgi:uncharacterized alkaline shock family protein YloU